MYNKRSDRRIHPYSVNYNRRDGRPKGRLVNVGFWLNRVPQLLLWCSVFGHKPVVDGVNPIPRPNPAGYLSRRSRWVVCDRCGLRPDPQGSLDPNRWNIGDRYTGGHTNPPATRHDLIRLKDREHYLPGTFEVDQAHGELGGQLIIGRQETGVGFELKVGSGGSEHVLAASLHAGPLGALYLHTAGIGSWVQRRLNPDVDGRCPPSRVIGVRANNFRIRWRWWAPRDATPKEAGLSWWRDGELDLRLRDRILGPKRYDHQRVPGGETTRLVRMPEGDYLVGLRLEEVTRGRRRGRRTRMPYSVDWSALGKGIPTEGPLRGRIYGASVTVPDRAVEAGTWPAAAAAAVAAQVTGWRTRHGWEPTGLVKVGPGLGTEAAA